MAVTVFTLTVYEGGTTRTHKINMGAPSTQYLKGVQYLSTDNKLVIRFPECELVVPFNSPTARDTFVTALFAGFDTGSSFALDNLGPVATTTTTTAAP